MSFSYFPDNEDSFIKYVTDHFNFKRMDMDWMDDIHNDWNTMYIDIIDNIVLRNSIYLNYKIITIYAGDILNAIKLWKNEYECDFEFPDCNHTFYAELAHISIYKKFYDIIQDKLINIKYNDDEFHELVDEYFSEIYNERKKTDVKDI